MIIEAIFDNEPSLITLLKIVAFMALFWGAIFVMCKPMIAHLVRNEQWLRTSSDRDYNKGAKEMYKQLGFDYTIDEYFEETRTKLWPNAQLITLQHLVGGLLCVPSILGWLDDSTSSSLACLGILSEIGWEMQDIVTLFYKRFFKPNGAKLVPTTVIVALFLHHSLASFLGIPLILHYRNFKVMHWICLDLQVAAVIALGVGEYTKLLNIYVPSQLLQFQVLTFSILIVMIWTRVIHWFYLISQFMIVWYNEKAWTLLITGGTIFALFTIFSVILAVVPLYQRFMKFLKVKAAHHYLPANADESTVQQSLYNLHESAAEVHTSPRMVASQNLKEKNKVT